MRCYEFVGKSLECILKSSGFVCMCDRVHLCIHMNLRSICRPCCVLALVILRLPLWCAGGNTLSNEHQVFAGYVTSIINLCGVIVRAVGIWILWQFFPEGLYCIFTTEQIGCVLYVCNSYCWFLLGIDKVRG